MKEGSTRPKVGGPELLGQREGGGAVFHVGNLIRLGVQRLW